ncbi:MAG: hypothetical protein RIK85_10465 [Marinobacter sp.]
MRGEFFAVGKPQFLQACRRGMNPAIALLVMARGTIGDNVTTSWSALAIFNHSGMARRRAQKAITDLVDAGLVKVIKKGTKPCYKLKKPKDDGQLIWLPNTIIDGAGKEIPPITKLRESGNKDLLQKFIELYFEQDLESDGGIPRSIAWSTYSRTVIGPVGPFTLYGFDHESTMSCTTGPLEEFRGHEDEDGNKSAWTILNPLRAMGLLQHVLYMAESPDQESELIYPITPETDKATESLLCWLEEKEAHGFTTKAAEFDHHGIAMHHIKKATLVGFLRLTYRPKTSKTSRWWARERQQEEAMVGLVNHICFREEVRKCAHQG